MPSRVTPTKGGVVNCAVCGGANVTDLTHGRGEVRNVICHECGAHYYKERWWTKAEWTAYMNET